MASQKGKDLLLKIDGAGNGTFTTIAGLRARALVLNAATVDVTSQDSVGQWRELLDGTGIRNAHVTGAGIFKDQASDTLLQQAFFAGSIANYQIAIPAFGVIQGPFLVASLQYSGRHDNELAFDISLESAGALTFTAATVSP